MGFEKGEELYKDQVLDIILLAIGLKRGSWLSSQSQLHSLVETIHSGALLYSFGELFEDCPDN
jgi:hypothetical protein